MYKRIFVYYMYFIKYIRRKVVSNDYLNVDFFLTKKNATNPKSKRIIFNYK